MSSSKQKSSVSVESNQQMLDDLTDPLLADNPLAFVMYAFPWGQEGTELHDKKGPRQWQVDELQKIADHVKENRRLVSLGQMPKVYRSATVSGRGVGKSCLLVWLTLWHQSCHLGATTIVTANTETQLQTRTWAELGTWYTLLINKNWFEIQALNLIPQPWLAQALERDRSIDSKYYYARAQSWSEENSSSWAGVHNPRGVMLHFDEASGIPDPIWNTSIGFFTEPSIFHMWFTFSNPRKNKGAFFECFNKARKMWNTRHLDSRRVEGGNLEYLNAIIEQYGEESDVAKVEVKGLFPDQGEKQFISREVVYAAVDRPIPVPYDEYAPLIMGVDPARYGDDTTVIRWRQGRNGRVLPPEKMKGQDNMAVANRIAHLIDKYNPDAVAIDVGNGSGIIDRLREMKYKVTSVGFGEKSFAPEWANRRTEIWHLMREWLKDGCIDDDPLLVEDLVTPEYGFLGRSDKINLEAKEHMKKRGERSPDDGDALACTFAVTPARKDRFAYRGVRSGPSGRSPIAKGVDRDQFGE